VSWDSVLVFPAEKQRQVGGLADTIVRIERLLQIIISHDVHKTITFTRKEKISNFDFTCEVFLEKLRKRVLEL
jgi:hypothetical protein